MYKRFAAFLVILSTWSEISCLLFNLGKADLRIFEFEKENESLLEVIRILSTAECKNPNKLTMEDQGWTTVNKKKKKKNTKHGSAKQTNQQNEKSATSTESTTQ